MAITITGNQFDQHSNVFELAAQAWLQSPALNPTWKFKKVRCGIDCHMPRSGNRQRRLSAVGKDRQVGRGQVCGLAGEPRGAGWTWRRRPRTHWATHTALLAVPAAASVEDA